MESAGSAALLLRVSGDRMMAIPVKTLIIKSLLSSLYQREGWFDRLTMTFVILSLSKDRTIGLMRVQICNLNLNI